MASEDENKKASKPFPWWTILITVISVAIIIGLIFMYRRRMSVNSSMNVAAGAVPGPNVAPPPGVMGARLNSSAAPNAAGRV
jgi:hypothetical protein